MSKTYEECLDKRHSYEPLSDGFNFRELEEFNKKYLDTLDLSKYLSISNDVNTIIDLIEKDYDDNDCLPQELEGCIFNFLGTEDIGYYLADRYRLHLHEQVIYKYTLY